MRPLTYIDLLQACPNVQGYCTDDKMEDKKETELTLDTKINSDP